MNKEEKWEEFSAQHPYIFMLPEHFYLAGHDSRDPEFAALQAENERLRSVLQRILEEKCYEKESNIGHYCSNALKDKGGRHRKAEVG